MSTFVYGIFSSEHIDSSGEITSLEGMDITDLIEGKGFFNFEHSNSDPSDLVGKITYAKKIYKESDCENDKQRKCWKIVEKPYLYGEGSLFDSEGHPGAVAIAAIIRNAQKNKEELVIGFSIEGSTLKRDENILKETVVRRCAITLRPCNKMAKMSAIADSDEVKKSEKFTYKFDPNDFTNTTYVSEIKEDLQSLIKTLTASMGNVAPSNLTGGSVFSKESIIKPNFNILSKEQKNKIKKAIRDWDRTKSIDDAIKAELPELSSEYLNHFKTIVKELSIRKNNLIRLDSTNSYNNKPCDKQKELCNGIYVHPSELSNKDIVRLNDKGNKVLLHYNDNMDSVKYYNIARDFFNLSEYLPTIHSVKSHEFESPILISEHKPRITIFENKDKVDTAIQNHRLNGGLHKIKIMDFILGNNRNLHDIGIDDKDTLQLFNNKLGQPDANGSDIYGIENDIIHPDVSSWLDGLDEKHFLTTLNNNDIVKDMIIQMLKRLKICKKHKTVGGILNKFQANLEF